MAKTAPKIPIDKYTKLPGSKAPGPKASVGKAGSTKKK